MDAPPVRQRPAPDPHPVPNANLIGKVGQNLLVREPCTESSVMCSHHDVVPQQPCRRVNRYFTRALEPLNPNAKILKLRLCPQRRFESADSLISVHRLGECWASEEDCICLTVKLQVPLHPSQAHEECPSKPLLRTK